MRNLRISGAGCTERGTSRSKWEGRDLIVPLDPNRPSGKRIKRGLYRTAQGWLLNADCNGAANIGRKVAMMLGLDLSGISRGSLSAPLRVPLWS
jgi:hypothetical protein